MLIRLNDKTYGICKFKDNTTTIHRVLSHVWLKILDNVLGDDYLIIIH